jgi:DUF2934 family protein
MTMGQESPSHHDQIAVLAYRFYEESGRPEGCASEHWSRAEQAVREMVDLPPESERPSEAV